MENHDKYIGQMLDNRYEIIEKIRGVSLYNVWHTFSEEKREELLKINGSTEIAFKSGLNCQMIEGDPMNFKITTLEDLSNFEALIKKYP